MNNGMPELPKNDTTVSPLPSQPPVSPLPSQPPVSPNLREQRLSYLINAGLGALALVTVTAAVVKYRIRPSASGKKPAVESPQGSAAEEAIAKFPPPEGYREAETLKVLKKNREFNLNRVKLRVPGSWFDGTHLLASQTQKGDWVEFGVSDVPAGKWSLSVFLSKVYYFGSVQISWNGKPLGQAIDLHGSRPEVTGEIKLGEVRVLAKGNVLRFEAVEGSAPNQYFEFAIDGVRFYRR